jgi:hypothetical protein
VVVARSFEDVVGGHVLLAPRLFGDVDVDRLAVFDDVLGATVERFAALMAAEGGAGR